MLTRRVSIATAICLCTHLLTPVAADQKADLAQVLAKAAAYHDRYLAESSGVLLDEHYQLMDVTGGRTRHIVRISSDVVLVAMSGVMACLRDPYAVDTRPLREKTPRIMTLLADPVAPTIREWRQASSYPQQGAVHFMLDLVVKVNEPTTALQFISAAYQPNLKYKLDGQKTMNGVRVVGVRFEEPDKRDHTFILNTRGNGRATGRIWVDPETGAIHHTELWVNSKTEAAIVSVKYAPHAELKRLLPTETFEAYDEREERGGPRQMGSGADPSSSVATRISAQASATYSNARYSRIDLSKVR